MTIAAQASRQEIANLCVVVHDEHAIACVYHAREPRRRSVVEQGAAVFRCR
ncbi:Hypothetical protein A7982_03907 [Minicystis rosea]|nr:Hypothetical protein A7982_03907 [Minicystis rosea]